MTANQNIVINQHKAGVSIPVKCFPFLIGEIFRQFIGILKFLKAFFVCKDHGVLVLAGRDKKSTIFFETVD